MYCKFNGDPCAWIAIWDLFRSSVHAQRPYQSISNEKKLSYWTLLLSLSGPVAAAIRGLVIADQEYRVVAIDLLKKRFGDNVVIASSLYFQLRFWWDFAV